MRFLDSLEDFHCLAVPTPKNHTAGDDSILTSLSTQVTPRSARFTLGGGEARGVMLVDLTGGAKASLTWGGPFQAEGKTSLVIEDVGRIDIRYVFADQDGA